MAKLTFSNFPPCCQQLLRELEREGKSGARNCPKGHAVSLDYARVVETELGKKAGGAVPEKPAA
jgi:hypothetical protein